MNSTSGRPTLPSAGYTALGIALLVAVAVTGGPTAVAQDQPRVDEWRTYASDSFARKYSAASQIAASNIADLGVAWRWASADRDLQLSNPLWVTGRNEDTPILANGTLFTVTGLGLVAALDPASGGTRWLYDPETYKSGTPNNVGFISRGSLAYWTDGIKERILLGTGDAYLISLDARSGRVDTTFGTGGKVDLTADIPGAVRAMNFAARRPLVAGDVVVVGSSIADTIPNQQMPPGDVQAFDARTGQKLWTFHTVPRRGELGYETWLNEAAEANGSTNAWGGMSYDPVLDYVYVATSAPDNNVFGGHRLGSNLFSDAVICLEAKTGKRVWHFQAIHHDIWDYDLPATPVLGDITVDGRRIHALMQVSKQAFVYVLDRETGTPVWPIEERPVPPSTVPGEEASPTQPFPTKPPAFDRQGATEDNLIDFTPALRAQALRQLEQFDHGPLYTPPSERGTLTVPGVFGGANWGGAGFDPETGVLYVPSITMPIPMRARGLSAHEALTPTAPGLMTIDGLPIIKPPYSRITAIDMTKGEQLWMAPLGNGPQRHPLLRDLTLGPLGDGIHRASVLVTKTLLFVNVSRLANNGLPQPPTWAQWADPDADRDLLYVFDKRTGHLLRTVALDGMSAAAPMTYLFQGQQYVVMAVGGGTTSEVVAFRLGATETASAALTTPVATPTNRSTATNVWSGIYTEQQATVGRALYANSCAVCHAENLAGDGFAPPLVGAPFSLRWQSGSLFDLFTVVKETMPQEAPASLSDQEYAAIVAFLLNANSFPSGQTAIPTGPDQLRSIALTPQP